MAKIRGKSYHISGDVLKFIMENTDANLPDMSSRLRMLLDLADPEPVERDPLFEPLASRSKYSVDDLEINESKIIPWRVNQNGVRIDQRPIHNSIRNYSRRTGKQFVREGTAFGLKVVRVK